jgi:hypothetical protein
VRRLPAGIVDAPQLDDNVGAHGHQGDRPDGRRPSDRRERYVSGRGQPYQDAVNWKSNFSLSSVAVAVDPNFSFAPAGQMTVGLPVQTVIDPRTMQVVDIQEGSTGNHTMLLNLAQMNKGM